MNELNIESWKRNIVCPTFIKASNLSTCPNELAQQKLNEYESKGIKTAFDSQLVVMADLQIKE